MPSRRRSGAQGAERRRTRGDREAVLEDTKYAEFSSPPPARQGRRPRGKVRGGDPDELRHIRSTYGPDGVPGSKSPQKRSGKAATKASRRRSGEQASDGGEYDGVSPVRRGSRASRKVAAEELGVAAGAGSAGGSDDEDGVRRRSDVAAGSGSTPVKGLAAVHAETTAAPSGLPSIAAGGAGGSNGVGSGLDAEAGGGSGRKRRGRKRRGPRRPEAESSSASATGDDEDRVALPAIGGVGSDKSALALHADGEEPRPEWEGNVTNEHLRTDSFRLSKDELDHRHKERQSHNLIAARLQLKYKSREAKLKRREEACVAEEERLGKIYDFVEEQRERIDGAQQRMEERLKVIEAAAEGVKKQKADLERAKKRLSVEKIAVNDEKEKIEAREAAFETMREDFGKHTMAREAELLKMQDQLSSQRVEYDRLTTDVQNKRQEMLAAENELTMKRAEMERLQREVAEAHESLGLRERSNQRLAADTSTAREKLERRAKEIEVKENELRAAQQALDDRRAAHQLEVTSVAVKNREAEADMDKVKSMRLEVTSLRMKLAMQVSLASNKAKNADDLKQQSLARMKEAQAMIDAARVKEDQSKAREEDAAAREVALREREEALAEREQELSDKEKALEKKTKAHARAVKKFEAEQREALMPKPAAGARR
mmetsp:Transcript_19239/g.67935  ORF Transcript_19239/g.67935 Transcript_19239/m.67935 type:complete len:659 (-) Transcript_19239:158-2134(-)